MGLLKILRLITTSTCIPALSERIGIWSINPYGTSAPSIIRVNILLSCFCCQLLIITMISFTPMHLKLDYSRVLVPAIRQASFSKIHQRKKPYSQRRQDKKLAYACESSRKAQSSSLKRKYDFRKGFCLCKSYIVWEKMVKISP